MTWDQAERLDRLIRCGADDATCIKEGFTETDVAFQRVFTENQMYIERLTNRLKNDRDGEKDE